ncbi:MFS transporter [Formosa sediminum]|uniref:MFS transporter n=1 Tax=Formosa sediminum TaxID=2594004 RepID=A0A516GLQ7_9FLAO|nr:MFS transporter [Formosa sediminum]QDO92454.1 MFS transporter [Formosa sediminum]
MNKLTNAVLYLMSLSAGLVVANLYYNQPLLGQIAVDFGVSESEVSHVALSTQLGYAFGLLFIIPLGDKVANHKILQIDFFLMILALLAAATSSSLLLLIASSFFIGFTSALPQLFVPMAAQLSEEKDRGRSIGIVMSGLLIGILGSRVISGFIGEQYGWRTMYYTATIIMAILFVVLRFKLPKLNPEFSGTYVSLLKSVFHYFKTEPTLRLAALRGALSFGCLSAFWTTLVFLMEDNFGYGSTVTGLFGLLGMGGALGAAVVGKLNDKMSKNKIIIYATLLLIVSWLVFLVSAYSLIGIVVGVVLVDLGMQALHITNQSIIFSKNPEARNRVNTVYMVSFFIGGALGTSLGALAWEYYKWTGVSVLGLILSALILIVHIIYTKRT